MELLILKFKQTNYLLSWALTSMFSPFPGMYWDEPRFLDNPIMGRLMFQSYFQKFDDYMGLLIVKFKHTNYLLSWALTSMFSPFPGMYWDEPRFRDNPIIGRLIFQS